MAFDIWNNFIDIFQKIIYPIAMSNIFPIYLCIEQNLENGGIRQLEFSPFNTSHRSLQSQNRCNNFPNKLRCETLTFPIIKMPFRKLVSERENFYCERTCYKKHSVSCYRHIQTSSPSQRQEIFHSGMGLNNKQHFVP